MKNLIITTSLMIFAPTIVLAACPRGTSLDQTTGICTRSGCNGNCTYYVTPAPGENPNNEYDITVKPNQGSSGDIILGGYWDFYGNNINVRNFTVGEGITGTSESAIANSGSGTMKLPSTLKNLNGLVFNVGFHTIDLSDVKNLQSSNAGTYYTLQNTIPLNGVRNLQTLIISDDTFPISIGFNDITYNFPNREIQIQCKGTDLNACQNLIKNAASLKSRFSSFSVSSEYYQGFDDKGKLLEIWGPNGCTKYSYDAGGNLQRKTDENGNVLWARRIYTVDEATKAVKKQNTFSIRYR